LARFCSVRLPLYVGDNILISTMELIGQSPLFLTATRALARTARFEVPVLIQGETGTGKELAARVVHYQSTRGNRPFIPINCGALPEALVENELFGHERGAYTDARENAPGVVALAEGGTLFLDEVDALSAKGQVTLLRFLQDQRYRPLGATSDRRADVRIIAATNRSLEGLVDRGVFRAARWNFGRFWASSRKIFARLEQQVRRIALDSSSSDPFDERRLD